MSNPQPAMTTQKLLGIAFAVIIGFVLLAAALSGGDPSLSGPAGNGSSYSDIATDTDTDTDTATDTADDSSAGSPARTQFYDGGSITTGEGGELLYSDSNGNSFSSGG